LINVLLTPGQQGDAPLGERLLEDFEPGEYNAIIADAAYDSEKIRRRGKSLKAKACIKPNATRKRKRRYDRQRYKRRNIVERFIGWIKRSRRVATRYDKKAANYLGFVWLAATLVNRF
jgi:transposase